MSRPDIRLLISDVDGTLVRRDKSLSPANVSAARRLAENGVAMSLISARPTSGIVALAAALDLDGPFGAFNGGTLFDRSGVIGAPARLDPAVAQRLLAILDAAAIDIWLYARGHWYVRDIANPHIPREILSAAVQPIMCGDFSPLCDVADKIVGVSDDAALLKRVEARAIAASAGRATVALSQPYFLDVTALAANKGDGVVAIAAALGVPLAEVAVIGDMPNDLPMFARAGLSIAMGQAPEAVRAAADWVTASNERDGVARAIERLLGDDIGRAQQNMA